MACFIDYPIDEFSDDGSDFAKVDVSCMITAAIVAQFNLVYLKEFWVHSLFYEYDGRLTIRFSFKDEKKAMLVKMALQVG